MLSLPERVLGLNSRELARAAPLFAYLFLVMAGSVASKAARDALFLDRFRAIDLPYVDIAIALLVGLVAGVYIRAGERTNLRNVQVGSLLAFAASAIVFWWLAGGAGTGAQEPFFTSPISRGSGALFVVIYVWVGVLSVLVPSQVWTLANYVMTTREAKRAFGFVGAGAILGWIVGGLATRVIVTRFGTESTLLWVALALIISAGLVWLIWSRRPSYIGDEAASPWLATPKLGMATAGEGGADPKRGFESRLLASFALVRSSRYLTAIALVIWLAAYVTTIAGWQFKAIAKEHIPDTDTLAWFFGTFNMVAGLVALALQVLVTGRVLKRVGVGFALFIVPTALALSSTSVLLIGTLLAAAALRASDQVLRYSIDKATVELLYLPVPASLTFRAKSFIDTVIYRLGDATGGLTVLLFAAFLGWSPVQLAWISLALVGGWFWVAATARRQYVENLREGIHQHRVDTERASAPVIERAAADLLAEKLAGEPDEILYALSMFEMAGDRSVHPAVRGLLAHDSPEVRERALRLLARAGDASAAHDVERLLYDDHLEVRTEALLYLTEYAHIDPLERIEQLGSFPDFSLRAAMAAFLARPGRAQNLEAARAILGAMVCEEGDAGRRARIEAARLIGTLPEVFDKELRLLLQDPDPDVAAAAIRSVARLGKRAFVPRIIERLGEPRLAPAAIAALATFGDRIVGTLRDTLVDDSVPSEIRREIPGVLQAIGTRAQSALMENVVEGDAAVRHRVIAALSKLAQQHPERPLDRKLLETVLAAEILGHYRSYQVLATMEAARSIRSARSPRVAGAPSGQAGHAGEPDTPDQLAEGLQQEAERIFRLLKMLYPSRDMHSAYVGLQSADPVVHDNAVEFLEAVLPPHMRAQIIPLFDRNVSIAERARLAARLTGAPVTTELG